MPPRETFDTAPREGEILLDRDPGTLASDASVVFIGRVRSAWQTRTECPKNMAAASAAPVPAAIEIDAPYRAGLDGLDAFSHLVVLTWLNRARRDLIVQRPRHSERPRGVFALRSPVRPNPVGMHVVEIAGIDREAGLIRLAAIDVLDGTPVIDLKPYYPSADAVPEAAG